MISQCVYGLSVFIIDISVHSYSYPKSISNNIISHRFKNFLKPKKPLLALRVIPLFLNIVLQDMHRDIVERRLLRIVLQGGQRHQRGQDTGLGFAVVQQREVAAECGEGFIIWGVVEIGVLLEVAGMLGAGQFGEGVHGEAVGGFDVVPASTTFQYVAQWYLNVEIA